jgi:mxaJ protein
MNSKRSLVSAGVLFLWMAMPALALHVCADPDYLPYSNRAGEGFENKIAQKIAAALGEPLEYTWASYRGHGGFDQFLAAYLDAKKCDLVLNIPFGSREELTTRPYYTSSYVFVFDKSRQYDISGMDAPILKKLKIGFERGTPVEDALKIRSMLSTAVPFDIAEDQGTSPASMLAALKDGRIDVLITWQPSIGGFLHSYPALDVVPIPNQRTLGAPEQYSFAMSMAVRMGDDALLRRLDDAIQSHGAELTSILSDSGVLALNGEGGTRH